MKEIETRDDISFLVNTFYHKIRKDNLLGPIFNNHIAEEKWPEHLEKLKDFWETNLFGVAKFKGNPTQKHLNVDRNLNHKTNQKHFGRWLQIWFQTIDANFEGHLANKAKEASRRMAHGQFMAIFNHR
ncbi:group III truncated hemoglobin [Polaribacter cellanae]|uniref:Group III truncated hemoglobin n=1 Tax=Polaribacter cellanae TaxID=2818493 RepID=A0A975CPX5_9FLAO|nr:group III truncated hemoglobin [Polaribacter cellanae]QTE23185.1 group III truncated hemoglobin [Polaribacter cellanae]